MMMNQGAQQMQQASAQAFIAALQRKSAINGIRLHICQTLSQNNFNNQKVIALISTVMDVAEWNSTMNGVDINTSIQQAADKMTDWYTASQSLNDPMIIQNLTPQMRQEATNTCAEFQGVQNSVAAWKAQRMQQQNAQFGMPGMGMMGGMAVGQPMMGTGFPTMGGMMGGMQMMPIARRAGGHANAQQLSGQFGMMNGVSNGMPATAGFFQTDQPVMGSSAMGVGVVLGVPDGSAVPTNNQQQIVQRSNLAPITRGSVPEITPGRPLNSNQIVVPPLNVPQPKLESGEEDVSNENIPDGGVLVLDYASHATYALLPALTKAEAEAFVVSEETFEGIVDRMGSIPYPKAPRPNTDGAVKMKDVPANNTLDLGELATLPQPNLLTAVKLALSNVAPDFELGDTVVRLRHTAYYMWSIPAAKTIELRKALVKGAPTHAKLITFLDAILKGSLSENPEFHRDLILDITKLANYIIRHEIGLSISIDSYALDAVDLYDDLMKRGKEAEANLWGAAAKTISDTLLRIIDDEAYQATVPEDTDEPHAGFAITYDIITIPVLASQLPLGAKPPKGHKGVRFGVVYKHAHPGLHRLCTGFFAEKAVSAYKVLMTPDGRCLHVHKSRVDDTFQLTELRV